MAVLESIGGAEGCRKLATGFYARVARDPVLRPLFPGKTMTCAIEEFSAFLVQFLDGPSEKSQRRWWLSLRESHARFNLSSEHRAAWMNLMIEALNDVELDQPTRTALRRFFEDSSAYVVKQAQSGEMAPELARRWKRQLSLDDAVAAIRKGEVPSVESFSPSVVVGLLVEMIRSGNPKLAQYARDQIVREPSLAHERTAGWTFLHVAAAAGDFTTVELLLRMGADVNALDGGRHTPLYSLGNGGGRPGSERIVRLLVDAGADVNASGGSKHCTPLHMAARRGNVEIARALIECGADLNARDTKGETPLKRAQNCKKPKVAELLATAG